jgi:hypothetical protein
MKNARVLLEKKKFVATVSNLSKRAMLRKVMGYEYYSSIHTKLAKIV